MRTVAGLIILSLLILVPTGIASQDEEETGICEAEYDAQLTEARDQRDGELADAESKRDDELEDANSTEEQRNEAQAQHSASVEAAEAEYQRNLERAEADYTDCLADGSGDDHEEELEREEDDDEFEDDEAGFEDRHSRVRFNKREPGFIVPASRPLHHQFLELIEFVDDDADGAFDPGEPVLARYDLARPPDDVQGNATRRVTYELEPGRLHLDVRSVGDATKFDVTIEGYAFASLETRIALGSVIRVADGVRFDHVQGAPAILAGGTGKVPYLSWIETVHIDGRSEPVGWSVLASLSADGGDAVVYWAYPQGESITHDPMLGVTLVQAQRLLEARAFWMAGAASLAFLGLGILRRRL